MSLTEMLNNSVPSVQVRFSLPFTSAVSAKIKGMSNERKQQFSLALLRLVKGTCFNSDHGRNAVGELNDLCCEDVKRHPAVRGGAIKTILMLSPDRHTFWVWHTSELRLNFSSFDAHKCWAGPLMQASCVDERILEDWITPFVEKVESTGAKNAPARGVVWLK
jgi:hypothetical protein